MGAAIQAFSDAAWQMDKAIKAAEKATAALGSHSSRIASDTQRLRRHAEEIRTACENAADALNGGVAAW